MNIQAMFIIYVYAIFSVHFEAQKPRSLITVHINETNQHSIQDFTFVLYIVKVIHLHLVI